jgi:hypothetical protein
VTYGAPNLFSLSLVNMKSKRCGIEIRIAEARDAAAMSTLLGELGFPSPAAVISERLEALNVAEEKTLVATQRSGHQRYLANGSSDKADGNAR